MRRGILGGTFDPPHLAHLLAGEAAYRSLGLELVSFVPAGAPWQKADLDVSAPAHRWAMTRLAVEAAAYFDADDREVSRQGWTYTIDTLKTFKPGEELVLILGADAAAGLRSWRRYEEVLSRVEIAVVPRPGVTRGRVSAAVGEHHWLDTPALDISGTMIRERRRAGLPIRFLVPEPVYGYIEGHDLYAG